VLNFRTVTARYQSNCHGNLERHNKRRAPRSFRCQKGAQVESWSYRRERKEGSEKNRVRATLFCGVTSIGKKETRKGRKKDRSSNSPLQPQKTPTPGGARVPRWS